MTTAFQKQVYLGDNERGRVFAFVKYEFVKYDATGRLSISGVEGPFRNGDARGSCGQIVDVQIPNPNPEIDLAKFMGIWRRWHLNDMNPGTPAQMAIVRGTCRNYDEALALLAEHDLLVDHGYKYGTAWLREEVPGDALTWLAALPGDPTDLGPWSRF